MYLILTILAVIGLLAAVLWHIGKKPARHKNVNQDDLGRYLEALLHRGHHEGFLVIEDPSNSGRFVQVSKRIEPKGVVSLRLDFPLAAWSTQFYGRLKTTLTDNDIEFGTCDGREGEGVQEFLVVNFGQDVSKAVDVVCLILQKVFGLDPSDFISLYFENVSPKDEKIGFNEEGFRVVL